MTDSFRNVKNLFVELKQLFYLEKKKEKTKGVVAYEHFTCYQNEDAKML